MKPTSILAVGRRAQLEAEKPSVRRINTFCWRDADGGDLRQNAERYGVLVRQQGLSQP